jgi:hypothetical protein
MREREIEGLANSLSYHIISFMEGILKKPRRSFSAKQTWNFQFITTRNRDPNFGKYQNFFKGFGKGRF